MASVKQEETKTIGGKLCYNKEKAAEYLGMKLSAFNKFLALMKAGRTKVKLTFIQYTKNAPMWFEVEELDFFLEQVKSRGMAY